MLKFKLVVHIFFIISYVSAQNTIINSYWGKQLLKYPQQFFISSYEKDIFQKFQKKFSHIQFKKIEQYDTSCLIELYLSQGNAFYSLILELDKDKKIASVYRNLLKTDIKQGREADEIILKWLGKFFYRIDAGDSAAMYDMVFNKNIDMRYNGLSDKSKIIIKLLEKFTGIVKPLEINLQKKSSLYSVRVSFQFSADLFFQIPAELASASDTDVLQENLLNMIMIHMNNNYNTGNAYSIPKDRSKLLEQVNRYYPESIIQDDEILIPYPQRITKVLKEIRYEILGEKFDSGFSFSEINAQVNLEYKKDRGLITMNNTCKISLYQTPGIQHYTIEQSEKALQDIFKMILLFPFINAKDVYTNLKGFVQYRGYNVHKIILATRHEWAIFWEVLRKEGSVYFYPSRIDDLENVLLIHGLVYVIKDNKYDLYHFGELTIRFPKGNTDMEINLIFYPFVTRMALSSLKE